MGAVMLESDHGASLRDQKLLDDFVEELAGIAHEPDRWYIDPNCGIRCWIGVDQFCPMSLVWWMRTGRREHFTGKGHLEPLLAKLDHELKLGPVSLKLADAIDRPHATENQPLAERLLEAVGLLKGKRSA